MDREMLDEVIKEKMNRNNTAVRFSAALILIGLRHVEEARYNDFVDVYIKDEFVPCRFTEQQLLTWLLLKKDADVFSRYVNDFGMTSELVALLIHQNESVTIEKYITGIGLHDLLMILAMGVPLPPKTRAFIAGRFIDADTDLSNAAFYLAPSFLDEVLLPVKYNSENGKEVATRYTNRYGSIISDVLLSGHMEEPDSNWAGWDHTKRK